MKPRLGVNIDHVATLRRARGTVYPDPAATLPILAACRVDQVTLHLREDRRHITDADLDRIARARVLPVNLEMAVTPEMTRIALRAKPFRCTFVPEKRREITTEGGLDCLKSARAVARAAKTLRDKGIRVALFVDPEERQLEAASRLGADAVELHTGAYAGAIEAQFAKRGRYAPLAREARRRFEELRHAALFARALGLDVFAGHGLHAGNLSPLARVKEIEEYNIGHAIIARAVFIGLKAAIREIRQTLKG